jgi:hypothetical protein
MRLYFFIQGTLDISSMLVALSTVCVSWKCLPFLPASCVSPTEMERAWRQGRSHVWPQYKKTNITASSLFSSSPPFSLPSNQPNQRQSSHSSLAISHAALFPCDVRFALGENVFAWRLSSQQGPVWGLREVIPARNMMVIIVSRLAPQNASSCLVLALLPSRGQMKSQQLGWLDVGLHHHMQPCLLSAKGYEQSSRS